MGRSDLIVYLFFRCPDMLKHFNFHALLFFRRDLLQQPGEDLAAMNRCTIFNIHIQKGCCNFFKHAESTVILVHKIQFRFLVAEKILPG